MGLEETDPLHILYVILCVAFVTTISWYCAYGMDNYEAAEHSFMCWCASNILGHLFPVISIFVLNPTSNGCTYAYVTWYNSNHWYVIFGILYHFILFCSKTHILCVNEVLHTIWNMEKAKEYLCHNFQWIIPYSTTDTTVATKILLDRKIQIIDMQFQLG